MTFILSVILIQVLARDKLSRYGMGGLVGSVAVLGGFLLMAGLEAGGGGHRCLKGSNLNCWQLTSIGIDVSKGI